MHNQMVRMDEKRHVFGYLLCLTGFFLLLETSFFIQCIKAYSDVFVLISNHLSIPMNIVPGILFFVAMQLLIHFSYCLLISISTLTLAKAFCLSQQKTVRLATVLWVLGITTILIANQYFYPNSKFSALSGMLFSNLLVLKMLCMLLITICSAIAGLVCLILLQQYALKHRWLMATALLSIGFLFLKPTVIPIQDASTPQQPNIILIGVDSLRPDFLSYFGRDIPTPFFDAFLNQATVFAEAVTPLARTFPSWASILLGDYPKNIGVRFDLSPQEHLQLEHTLPAILRQQGYETIFATDETRFSNIDKNFGFDDVVTPPMGLNDFLVGTFNDFPMSNLLINTPLGKWLFPNSYGNRPVDFTYEPNSFLNLIRPVLQTTRTKPLFFAIHFCLPHAPYRWSKLSTDHLNVVERYEASILRVDNQLRDFFALLKQTHVLDHAIVVLLSDHGEALELPGDRITEKDLFLPAQQNKKIAIPKFYPPSLDDEQINQSAGHGTDVLGLPQYHSLLAFRLYGLGPQQVGSVAGVVSLMSINPTVLELIGLKPFVKTHSLAAIVQGKTRDVPKQHIFLESDFSPASIRTVYPEVKNVIVEGIELYRVDPTSARLVIKDSMTQMLIDSKQLADIYGEWMLALYPQNKQDQMPILVNLATGEWTNDLQSPFAQHSPVLKMLTALKQFYGDEINCSQNASICPPSV